MTERIEHAGAAPETELTATLSAVDTTFTVLDGTGYPTGTVGPFFMVVDPGTPLEEKIKCASRTGNSFAVAASGRGWDGTTGTIHDPGAIVRHVLTAGEVDETNVHIVDTTTRDDHLQYLTVGRHDDPSRHGDATLGTPTAPPNVTTASAAGVSQTRARSDHTHGLAAGAINSAGQFAAGVAGTAARVAGIPAGGVSSTQMTADSATLTLETTILSRSYTVSADTTTRNILIVAHIFGLDDTDDDVDYVVVRVKRGGVTLPGGSQRITTSGALPSGASVVVVDEDVASGTYTYSVTVNPNAGEFAVTATGGTGAVERYGVLWVADLGS